MQEQAFCGHEEARENLSTSCSVNCDNYLELLSLRAKNLPEVKLKINSLVSSFGHGKGLGSVLTFKTKWCDGQWKYYPLIIWQKLLRVLNLKKTSIIHIHTVSSLDETSDISKLEQFHISDWIVKEQSRRDFSKLIKVEKTDRTLSAFLNEKIKISFTWPWAGSLPWVRRCRWQPSGLETQYLLLGDAIFK